VAVCGAAAAAVSIGPPAGARVIVNESAEVMEHRALTRTATHDN
jgi:hypothetical protein